MSRVPPTAVTAALATFNNGDADVSERTRMRRALKASGAIFPGTEFMGAAEAAETLGVRSPNLRKVRGLPEPVIEVRSGPLWFAEDIRRLAGTLARRRGSHGKDEMA